MFHSSQLKSSFLSFQSPYKYVFVVFFTSFILKLPRFFQFKLVTTNGGEIDYWTTAIMEDPVYLRFSSYWDDLFSTGFLPLAILTFFNVRIYSKVKKFYPQIIQCVPYFIFEYGLKVKFFENYWYS